MTYKNITIIPRRDTRQNWINLNPVLKEKEFIVVDIGKNLRLYKIGDGIHNYKQLPFRSFKYCMTHGYSYGHVVGTNYLARFNVLWEREE